MVCFHLEVGSGEPMAVVPGGPGFSHDYLRPGLDPLAERLRLIYVDLAGCGKSAPIPEGNLGLLDLWVDQLEELRASLGLSEWGLFGHSNAGVFVVLSYARRFPERVSRLVLCAGAAAFDYAEELQSGLARRATASQMRALGEVFTNPLQTDGEFRDRFLELLPLYFSRDDETARTRIAAQTTFSAAPFDLFKNHELSRFDARPWLGQLAMPALILWGGADLVTPPAAVRPFLGMPRAHGVELSGSGHFPFLEEPGSFASACVSWLERA
jgi:proline iminopeptidase